MISPVTSFLMRVLLWLPVCFTLSYFTAGYWLYPLWAFLDVVMPALLPNLLAGIERHGHDIEVVTRVVSSAARAGDMPTRISFELNPLIYAYGLPLYAGLALAAPTRPARRKARNLVIGLLVVFPVLLWGASFDILETLAITLASDTAAYADFSGFGYVIAWCALFGHLILPGAMPLAVWLALHRDFLRELAPAFD